MVRARLRASGLVSQLEIKKSIGLQSQVPGSHGWPMAGNTQ